MKKAIFRKSLALLLSLMVLLTAIGGALSVFADNTAGDVAVDVYGTAADGITVANQGYQIDQLPETEGLQNGDFSEGLKYWGPKDDRPADGSGGSAGDYAYLSDGNLVLKSEAQYDGLRSTLFTLPFAKAGDTPIVLIPAIHENQLNIRLTEVGGQNLVNTNYGAWGGQPYQELTAFSNLQIESAASKFYLTIENASAASVVNGITIDCIYIAKLDENGEYIDLSTGKKLVVATGHRGGVKVYEPPKVGDVLNIFTEGADLIGTEEEGITGIVGGDGFHANVVCGLPNGDFSRGFLYWGGKGYDNPGAAMSLVTEENGNKYIKFNSDVNIEWKGVATPDIGIPDGVVEDGDVITAIIDVKNSDGKWQFVLDQRNSDAGRINSSSSGTALAYNGEWTTIAFNPATAVSLRKDNAAYPGTLNSGYYTFYIMIESTIASGGTTCFDNIRLVKVIDGKYCDLYTEEPLSFESTSYPDGSPIGGTVANGVDTGNGNSNLANSAGEKFFLRDCISYETSYGSYGDIPSFNVTDSVFKFWSSKNDRVGFASDQMILVEYEEGKYAISAPATFKSWDGIETARFTLTAGKQYALLYSYWINPVFASNVGSAYAPSVNLMCNYSAVSGGNAPQYDGDANVHGKWIGDDGDTHTAVEDGEYYVQIQFGGSGATVNLSDLTELQNAENPYPFLINDIKVCEVRGGHYVDIATGIAYYKNGELAGGTEQDGAAALSKYLYGYGASAPTLGGNNGSFHHMYGYSEGFINNDFSLGLKYWALKGDRTQVTMKDGTVTSKPSDLAFVNENGVLVIKETYDTSDANNYYGLQTIPFSLSANGVKAGDKLCFSVEGKGESMNITLRSKVGDSSQTAFIRDSNNWGTHRTNDGYVTVGSDDELFYFQIQCNNTTEGGQLDNLNIWRADRGGAGEVTLDGKLLAGDRYGDANADGKVDLIDLVRTKKYMLENTTPIFSVAADIDASGVVDASDATYITNCILGIESIIEA